MRPALAGAARVRRTAARVALLLAGLVVGSACRAERLPTEAFARLPFVVDASLSPSGERLALLLNTSAGRVLATRDGPTGPLKAVLKADESKYSLAWMEWANDERLLVGVHYPDRRNFVPVTETRLLSVRYDGSDTRNLLRSVPITAGGRVSQIQDHVIDWLPDDPQHVLIELRADGSTDPGVYRLDVDRGLRTPVHNPQRDVLRWFTDGAHRVRVGVRQRDADVEVLVCDPEGRRWRTAWHYTALSRESVTPLGFGKDPNRLYVRALHEGRQAVFEVDLADPALPRTLKLADAQRDMAGSLVVSKATGEPVGVAGAGTAGYWDADHLAWLRAIDQRLPERVNRIVGSSRDDARYLVRSSGNGVPAEYYLGDRRNDSLALLVQSYPALPVGELVGKRSVQVAARDGLMLDAYLSLPRGVEARPLPLVLLPPSDAHGRSDTDFDLWSEFLANRGYAVMRVNARGARGYGHDFMAAGLRQWGLEMQDDLADAVKWAVAQGLADPRRVCIVGTGYGGYAALMGVIKTPELYRCAVSLGGVSDLIDLWQYQAEYINGAAMADLEVGNAWRDSERLEATSPRLRAKEVGAPVLLVHGTADRDIPYDQSTAMAKALAKAGKPHRFVTLEDGDHHLRREADRLRYFRELEDFLAEHLAAAAAP